VLILTESYGGGHYQVARAVEEALLALDPGLCVQIRDFMSIANPALNRLLAVGYVTLVQRFRRGYFWVYQSARVGTDNGAIDALAISPLRRVMLDMLLELSPRVIVCCYPIEARVLSIMRERGERVPPVVTVVTDVVPHKLWAAPNIDVYVVPSELSVRPMVECGADASRVTALGMPLRTAFTTAPPARDVEARPRPLQVLMMGGSMGAIEHAVPILMHLDTLPSAPEVTVVTSRNNLMKKRLTDLQGSIGCLKRVLGFVDNVVDLMDSSDVLISKPGGVTVFESLARGLPLLAYRPIPGQEVGNAWFLETTGAGRSINTITGIGDAVERLARDTSYRVEMRRAAAASSKPHAAARLANLVIRLALRASPALPGAFMGYESFSDESTLPMNPSR